MPKSDLKTKTNDELEALLSNYKKEGMNLRFQNQWDSLKNHLG